MIEATEIVFAAPGGQALDGLSLDVASKERVGIVLPADGSGSLLLRILAALVRPSSGYVVVDGIDLVADPLRARERLVYVTNDTVRPAPLLVGEWIQGLAAARGVDVRPRLNAILDKMDLTAHASVDRLRADGRALLALATAVAIRPKVALLDAPLRGVDGRRRQELMAWALDELTESTVILASDDQAELALCHRRLRLTNGRLEPESKEQMRCAG
jgi:ABC-type multidrug transport system ATPase subunit